VLDDDYLKVFARHDQRIIATPVHPLQELNDVGLEGRLPVCIEGCEGAIGWAVVGLEDL
jgi:hypothetical protein